MILSGNEIAKEVKQGHITIEPFSVELINPNSYNYRLGSTLLEITDDMIEPTQKPSYKLVELTRDGYVLRPDRLYLGATYEQLGSDKYVTSLIGRSSVGRLGLFVQITADLGNLGAKHHWTLELHAVQPIRVYPHMKIGQVSFWQVAGSSQLQYAGKYYNHSVPHHSKLYEELEEVL